jgi:hypothetical protein
MEIGIIGFGRFGRFAAKVLRNDFKVHVYDQRKLPRQRRQLIERKHPAAGPRRDALIDGVGDLHLAAIARAPLALVASQRLGGGIARARGFCRGLSRHAPAVDGEADALADECRAVPGGISSGDQPI